MTGTMRTLYLIAFGLAVVVQTGCIAAVAGVKVIVCTPSVIGELPDGKNKADTRLDEYSDLSRKVAKKMKVPVCDLRKAFLTHLEANNKDGKAKGILTSDTVHLNDAGNKFVAETMLKSLGE